MTSQTTTPASPETQPPARTNVQASASLSTLAKQSNSGQMKDVLESILWRIDSRAQSSDTQAVGITGCTPKSGSTSIAAALAIQASALQNGRVLLIDANWQMPGLLETFNLKKSSGLYDILSGEQAPGECEPQTVSEHLDIMCRGKWHEEQPTSVRQELVDDLLADLKTEYSLILVDLPSAQNLRSAVHLARKLDGALLVARFEGIKQPQAQRALRRLHEDGIDVWGSVLNRHRQYVPQWLQSWF